jgi:hypothetical protein
MRSLRILQRVEGGTPLILTYQRTLYDVNVAFKAKLTRIFVESNFFVFRFPAIEVKLYCTDSRLLNRQFLQYMRRSFNRYYLTLVRASRR